MDTINSRTIPSNEKDIIKDGLNIINRKINVSVSEINTVKGITIATIVIICIVIIVAIILIVICIVEKKKNDKENKDTKENYKMMNEMNEMNKLNKINEINRINEMNSNIQKPSISNEKYIPSLVTQKERNKVLDIIEGKNNKNNKTNKNNKKIEENFAWQMARPDGSISVTSFDPNKFLTPDSGSFNTTEIDIIKNNNKEQVLEIMDNDNYINSFANKDEILKQYKNNIMPKDKVNKYSTNNSNELVTNIITDNIKKLTDKQVNDTSTGNTLYTTTKCTGDKIINEELLVTNLNNGVRASNMQL